ncbi:MAG: FG-GAP repeat protein [Planctomycetes bacterium ADurb.Bin412]|nr:MAG: FG-GAP repeat protein [Planctomycetes bacterium ADurb.Bin412]
MLQIDVARLKRSPGESARYERQATLTPLEIQGELVSFSGPVRVYLVISNTAGRWGGGISGGSAVNCTLVGNMAMEYGGGAWGSDIKNSIVYFNSAPTNGNIYAGSTAFSCSVPLVGGEENITNDPFFVDYLNGDFRLSPNSPCINVGTNAYVVGLVDLDGNPRIMGGTVDMGAYEALSSQGIDFPNPGAQLTTSTVVLAATADSGLPVSFLVLNGPALLSNGSNLIFNGTGLVSVVASQTGDATWNPATPVTNSFEVSKASATVTIPDVLATYDGTAKSASGTTAPAGLTLILTYNGATSPPTAVGSYAITGIVSDLMYQAVGTGTLTIGKGSQTITFYPIGRQYLTNVVRLAASAGSGLEVAFHLLRGPGILSASSNLTFTSLGTVVVVARQAGDLNWIAAPDVTQSVAVVIRAMTGDYDGDGQADLPIYDTVGGYWTVLSLTNSLVTWNNQWGWNTAKPVPGDYDGDGAYDLAVFDTVGGYWYIKSLTGAVITWKNAWGWSTAKPISGDFDGDGKFDLAVYDAATGFWYIKGVDGTVIAWKAQWGWSGVTVPTLGD